MSCSAWPPSLLEAAFFFCYSSTALAGGYSCVTLTLTLTLTLVTLVPYRTPGVSAGLDNWISVLLPMYRWL